MVLVSVLSYFVQSYMCVQLCYVFSFITFHAFSCHMYSLILVCRLCILYMLAVLTYGTSCNDLNYTSSTGVRMVEKTGVVQLMVAVRVFFHYLVKVLIGYCCTYVCHVVFCYQW